MIGALVARVLVKAGVVSYLRRLWREDDQATRQKADRHADKALASVNARLVGLASGVAAAADRIARLEAADRIARLEADVRALRVDVRALHDTAVQASVPDRLGTLEHQLGLVRATMTLDAKHRRRPERDALEVHAIAAHVAAAIGSAPMHEAPVAHLTVENLLPDRIYRELLEAVPPKAFFSQKDRIKQNLKISHVGIAPERTLDRFGFLEDEIIRDMIVPALMERFEPHIRRVYEATHGPALAPQVAKLPHEATAGRLMLRRPGYHLDPHLDPKRVVVTALLYFARPGDSEAYGTSFYRIDGTPRIDQTSTFYPEEQGLACALVKTVPFRPNTAVMFLNSVAAHGADIPASAPADTERYAYQFYVSPDSTALDMVLGGVRPDSLAPSP